jgi:hypothetical protein
MFFSEDAVEDTGTTGQAACECRQSGAMASRKEAKIVRAGCVE